MELADIMSFPSMAALEYLRCLVVGLMFYVIKKGVKTLDPVVKKLSKQTECQDDMGSNVSNP